MFAELVFQAAKRRLRRNGGAVMDNAGGGRASTVEYRRWREEVLKREYLGAFSVDDIRGKDVVDFGCGNGELTFLLARLGARYCTGVDLDATAIKVASSAVADEPVSFVCCSDPARIDLEDVSVDVIVCFDVMEHVMEYEAIIAEWRRVLRPNGRVLIHWQPWFHPYGHHCHDYISVPWAHVFVSGSERTEICARIVDLPEFQPPWWDLDADGNRVNRFRQKIEAGEADERGFLNELTMWRFERICRQIGLRIERRTLVPFQGPWLVRRTSEALIRLPGVREFFTANAIYTLSKS